MATLLFVANSQTVYAEDHVDRTDLQANDAAEEQDDRRRTTVEILQTARRLMTLGRPAEAYELLRCTMPTALASGIDTAPIRHLAAQALIAGGHLAQAEVFLEQLTEDRPDLDLVRLDHAALLFALRRDDEADAIFRDMRREERILPETRRQIEAYLQRLRARQRWQLDFDLGFWRDNNVNNAAEDESVALPAFGGLRFTLDQQPVRAWVTRTGARFRWREAVATDGRVYVETHGLAARNTALGASEFNRTFASLSTGLRVKYTAEIANRRRPGLLSADLGIQRNWRGGDGHTRGLWAGVGLEQNIGRRWRLGGFPRVWITRHDRGSDAANPHGRSLDLYVSRLFGPGWLTLGGKFSRETPERKDLRWRSREVSVRYAASFGRNVTLSANAGIARTRFDAEAPLFFTVRKDRRHDLGVTVSHRRLAWEGYLPELTLEWSRTESSIPFYDRNLRTLRIGLRRLF